jgi:cytochrome bd-type quinol oxidase subunit 2
MVQPHQRTRNPLSAATATVLLLIAVIGAFWVPFYARSAPKLGDFPFFYWFQLIWMPVVMVLCYLAYLLTRRAPAADGSAAGPSAGGTPGAEAARGDGKEAK